MKRLVGTIPVLLFALLFLPTPACSLGPKVEKHIAVWDANSETDLAGYYLYWRTPADGFSDTNKVVVPKAASPSYDLLILNLPPGQYIIAVSAYDTEDNESGLSNEITWDASYPNNPTNVKVSH